MALGFAAVLEADLRQLSSDARRSDGITGWLSGNDHPEVKEASERAVLKVRSFSNSPNPVAQIRASKVGC